MDAALELLKAGNIQAIADDLLRLRPAAQRAGRSQEGCSTLRFAISDGAATATANKKTASTVLIVTISGISLLVVLSVAFGILNARSISKPVKQLTRDVKRLAEGEMDINLTPKSPKTRSARCARLSIPSFR